MALRRLAVICSMLGLLLVASAVALASRTRENVAFDTSVLTLLNAIRIDHALAPLAVSPELSAAAEQHSEDMIGQGYFSHDSSDGSAFGRRIAHYYSLTSYRSWSVGENLLWSPARMSPAAALETWMASPFHRANILNPSWRQIGISAVSSPDAPGYFGERPATVITTDFGVRR
jgi:uncharacterized protein YkwD